MTPDRRVVPFRVWHYEWLLRSESAERSAFMPARQTVEALERENSWTGVVDGEVVVCAGTLQQWPRRHIAWAYIARRPGWLRHMPWITREVRRVLDQVPGRIEFTVRADFLAGMRWAEKLGFRLETPCLRAYGPEGEDHAGFVRLN